MKVGDVVILISDVNMTGYVWSKGSVGNVRSINNGDMIGVRFNPTNWDFIPKKHLKVINKHVKNLPGDKV